MDGRRGYRGVEEREALCGHLVLAFRGARLGDARLPLALSYLASPVLGGTWSGLIGPFSAVSCRVCIARATSLQGGVSDVSLKRLALMSRSQNTALTGVTLVAIDFTLSGSEE
ncbi:hypothetical protein MRX96_058619 [Rhipicephalus microplus]